MTADEPNDVHEVAPIQPRPHYGMKRLTELLQIPVWVVTIVIALCGAYFSYQSWDTATNNFQFQKVNHRPALGIKSILVHRNNSNDTGLSLSFENAGSSVMREVTIRAFSTDLTTLPSHYLGALDHWNGIVSRGVSAEFLDFQDRVPLSAVLILCARDLDGDGAVYFDEFDFVAHPEPKEPSGAIPMTGVNRTMAEKLRAGKICESKP